MVIAFINQKGGCGKSSSCFHLAGAFALQGRRVLLIDADPQGSLSQAFLGSTTIENLPAARTLADLFDDDSATLHDLVIDTAVPNIVLLPANQHLARHNAPEPESFGLKQHVLAAYLEQRSAADITLIDCPPNLYLCSWNALVAADFVVIPVPPEDFGTQGLRAVHQAIDRAQLLNSRLRLLGHLITRADRRLLVHQAYEQKLRQLYGDMVLQTVVPEATAFKMALVHREPVSHSAPDSQAANAMRALADELLARAVGTAERLRSAR
ncbi:MAG: ParA family protein [Planctomycetaceae bacterium]|nr:ParA family protein [Planctomycetaceae bacterium]